MSESRAELTRPIGDLDMYIAGEWVGSESGARRPIINPATGQAIGTLSAATRADAQRAIAAAAEAEEVMRWMTPAERSAMCKRVIAALERQAEEMARVVTLEQGKPYYREGKWESRACQLFFRDASEDILRIHGETIPSGDRNKRIITFWQSRGVHAVVTPWNFPFNIPSEYIAVCLAAGNPVVWVPAPTTSACAVAYARALAEADLPKGAFNLVIGEGAVVGDEIVAHPVTKGVCFTGSPVTGQKIAERAAGKPLLLELGGNGPFVVLADADLDAAAEGIVASAYFNAGQACSATERVLVQESVREALIEKLIKLTDAVKLGDPFDEETTMGPLNNEAVAAKMDRHLADAREKGARIIRGGGRAKGFGSDLYYQATLLDRVTPEMAVHREESFGPIVPVMGFETLEDGLRLANDNELGLISAVYTKNLKSAFWFGERIRTGIVNINEHSNYWETPVPYGGMSGKKSGLGRLGGLNPLREVMDQKAMIIDIERGGI